MNARLLEASADLSSFLILLRTMGFLEKMLSWSIESSDLFALFVLNTGVKLGDSSFYLAFLFRTALFYDTYILLVKLPSFFEIFIDLFHS